VYLVFTSKFVQAHPAAVEQFLEGWLNVVQKFANDPAGAAELASSAFNAKGAGKDIGTITRNSLDDLILTPDFAPNTEQYLTYLVNFLQKDRKTDTKMPDWSKAIDNSFLEKAEAATGYTPPPIPVGATDWAPPTGTS
jgi:ABC-type nitrate/sulfonate/bicarbonate transport system substrate-binding protein